MQSWNLVKGKYPYLLLNQKQSSTYHNASTCVCMILNLYNLSSYYTTVWNCLTAYTLSKHLFMCSLYIGCQNNSLCVHSICILAPSSGHSNQLCFMQLQTQCNSVENLCTNCATLCKPYSNANYTPTAQTIQQCKTFQQVCKLCSDVCIT